MTVPKVTLDIMFQQKNPPKAIGGNVFDGEKLIGVFDLDDLRRCSAKLRNLENQHQRLLEQPEGTPPMVRRLARVLCQADGFEPDATNDVYIIGDPDAGYAWAGYRATARALINAMREPTAEMLAAKRSINFVAASEPDDIGEWHAAIDAALGVKP